MTGRKAARTVTLAMARVAATQAGDRASAIGDKVVLRQAMEAESVSSPLECEGAGVLLLAGQGRWLLQPRAMPAPDLTHPFSAGAYDASGTICGLKFGGSRSGGGGNLSGGRSPGHPSERERSPVTITSTGNQQSWIWICRGARTEGRGGGAGWRCDTYMHPASAMNAQGRRRPVGPVGLRLA